MLQDYYGERPESDHARIGPGSIQNNYAAIIMHAAGHGNEPIALHYATSAVLYSVGHAAWPTYIRSLYNHVHNSLYLHGQIWPLYYNIIVHVQACN